MEMLNAQNVYEITKKHRAEITAERQIRWLGMGDFPGEWRETLQYRPSIMDALVLEHACHVGPSYLEAAGAATGWPKDMVIGFQQTMIFGKPIETKDMHMLDFQHWKGVILALMVIAKLKSRWEEAEDLFR